ncbi:uncharacterized protein LOC135686268 [Rhopilema esculentum]|uniref:uncharacterized protein LOC135686268 n=1 Tax=Rhopilema esculentum TaxID=499914 RepID=UPI0031CFD8B8|eukprot:gene3467-1847_t
MRLATLFSLVVLVLVAIVTEASASNSVDHFDTDAAEISPNDNIESDLEEEHERIKRSPGWRRRFRVRIRRPIRKIGRAVRKVGQGVKKAARKVKAVVKKVASKAKEAIKKAAGKLKTAWKKARDKTKSALRKVKDKVKSIGKLPVKLAKKLKDKLKEKILRKLAKEEGDEVSEETTVTESCDADCKFVRECLKVVELFKRSFCAFYTLRRKHNDFMVDRNLNSTLTLIINDIIIDSLSFYSELSNVLRLFYPSMKIEDRKSLSARCSKGMMPCVPGPASTGEFHKLKCLKPCYGFTGCAASDKELMQVVDKAAAKFRQEIERALKLIE